MIKLFQKTDKDIYAPISGQCVDITEVKDKTFANKLLGDGIAFVPNDNVVCAPFDGFIDSIFDTRHAFCMRRKDGLEVLIHIGIDTVNLKGIGFKSIVSTDQKVKKGEPVIEFDAKYLTDTSIDMTTMVILANENAKVEKIAIKKDVTKDDCIAKYTLE